MTSRLIPTLRSPFRSSGGSNAMHLLPDLGPVGRPSGIPSRGELTRIQWMMTPFGLFVGETADNTGCGWGRSHDERIGRLHGGALIGFRFHGTKMTQIQSAPPCVGWPFTTISCVQKTSGMESVWVSRSSRNRFDDLPFRQRWSEMEACFRPLNYPTPASKWTDCVG